MFTIRFPSDFLFLFEIPFWFFASSKRVTLIKRDSCVVGVMNLISAFTVLALPNVIILNWNSTNEMGVCSCTGRRKEKSLESSSVPSSLHHPYHSLNNFPKKLFTFFRNFFLLLFFTVTASTEVDGAGSVLTSTLAISEKCRKRSGDKSRSAPWCHDGNILLDNDELLDEDDEDGSVNVIT